MDIRSPTFMNQRFQERQAAGGAARCQDRPRLRAVPMGEEDEGAPPSSGGELLPLPASSAQGDGRFEHPVQLPGRHPGARRRVAPVVAGLGRASRVHERADGGAADEDLRRDGAVDCEHGLAVGPCWDGEREPVRIRGLPRGGHRRGARRATVVRGGCGGGGAGDPAPAGGHAARVRHQPHRGRVHLRVVGGGGRHAGGGVGAVGAPGAPPGGARGVEAAGGVPRRRREGAALDGVVGRERQVLRHRVPEPEAVAAPPRAPPYHAALPHVGSGPRRGAAPGGRHRGREAATGAPAAGAACRGKGRHDRRQRAGARRQGLEGLVVPVPEHRPPG